MTVAPHVVSMQMRPTTEFLLPSFFFTFFRFSVWSVVLTLFQQIGFNKLDVLTLFVKRTRFNTVFLPSWIDFSRANENLDKFRWCPSKTLPFYRVLFIGISIFSHFHTKPVAICFWSFPFFSRGVFVSAVFFTAKCFSVAGRNRKWGTRNKRRTPRPSRLISVRVVNLSADFFLFSHTIVAIKFGGTGFARPSRKKETEK